LILAPRSPNVHSGPVADSQIPSQEAEAGAAAKFWTGSEALRLIGDMPADY
jgi:hypothetical protein